MADSENVYAQQSDTSVKNDENKNDEEKLASGILSSEQQDALKQAFADIDIDNSGTISKSELRAALQLMGQIPTNAEITDYMAQTENGEFTKDEFCTFVENYIPLKTKEQIDKDLLNAFCMFDEDQDEFISKEEFKKIMTRKGDEPLTDAEADDLLDRLDTIEKDGQLNIIELGKLFMGDL